MGEGAVATSHVTKSFLISIITRDLSLTDAILELVDNSLDRAVEINGIDVTKALTDENVTMPEIENGEKLSVKVTITEDKVIIEDNCGGITRNDLQEEVFLFGNPRDESDHAGLSAFGIGMKRAFFKLGRYVEILTETAEEGSSAIVWDVNKWLEEGDENWDIPFTDPAEVPVARTFKNPGTILVIGNLNENAKLSFSQTQFHINLKNRIQTTYSLFIKSGFEVVLNDEVLSSSLPELFTSDEISYTANQITKDEVETTIIAGITPANDRVPRGWYVFCNGRMVIEADKTKITGWGDTLPGFHPKFNHFLGFVSFRSNDVRALPWSTTKQGVERDSAVYMATLQEMALQADPILGVLDRWAGSRGDDDTASVSLRDLLSGGRSTPLYAAAKEKLTFQYRPRADRPDQISVCVKKDRAVIEEIKAALGDPGMTNVALGELIFRYYMENEMS